MDKKDEIILQQLDVIRTMTQNNLNRMGSDFWGAPLTPDAPKSAVPKEVAPKANAPKSADGAKPNKPAASTGADEKKEPHQPGDCLQAARGGGTAECGFLAPHGLHRQPRYR